MYLEIMWANVACIGLHALQLTQVWCDEAYAPQRKKYGTRAARRENTMNMNNENTQ